jgi:hypothetical protein
MSERRSTRTGFLRRGAAATIAVAGVGAIDAAGGSAKGTRTDRLFGTVQRVGSRRSARVAVDDGDVVELTLAPSATVSDDLRSNGSADLTMLKPGDRIAFSGVTSAASRGAPTTVSATSLAVVYQRFAAVVTSDEGAIVRTASGEVSIDSKVRQLLRSRLKPGEQLNGFVRTGTQTPELVGVLTER